MSALGQAIWLLQICTKIIVEGTLKSQSGVSTPPLITFSSQLKGTRLLLFTISLNLYWSWADIYPPCLSNLFPINRRSSMKLLPPRGQPSGPCFLDPYPVVTFFSPHLPPPSPSLPLSLFSLDPLGRNPKTHLCPLCPCWCLYLPIGTNLALWSRGSAGI